MGLRETIGRFIPVFNQQTSRKVPAVETMRRNPTQRNIPAAWQNIQFMPPGAPIAGVFGGGETARGKDAQFEPRTFEYPPNVNAQLSPRKAYGLLGFTDLREYAESVPEVAQCIRIITEEIKAFHPRIVDKNGTEVRIPQLDWMTESPDKVNPYPVWLSRFLYNVLVYDAGCLYTPRNSASRITRMQVIDGSTIFVLIDQYGNEPEPPAPAYLQVIYGVPREYFNTNQLLYRPRHLRADAPYGRSAIEDSLQAINLLRMLWDYECKWYTEGTVPEQLVTSPAEWTPEQVLNFEDSFNARMSGNSEERAGRIRFLPNGAQSVGLKDAKFREDIYTASANTVRMTFGIPRTEFGESPGSGLGGTGFLEAMQNTFYRMCLAPMKSYIEGIFNYVLDENEWLDYRFELAFPRESADPAKEEEKILSRFETGLINRNEARQALGLSLVNDNDGNYFADPSMRGMMPGANPDMTRAGLIDVPKPRMVTAARYVSATRKVDVKDYDETEDEDMIPVNKLTKNLAIREGVTLSDDSFFGAPLAEVTDKTGKGIVSKEQVNVPVIWIPGGNPAAEALYLLDRALAKDSQHYLVPVTYETEYNGITGIVSFDVKGRKPVSGLDSLDPEYVEFAAVLDHVAGVHREPNGYLISRVNPERPILTIPEKIWQETSESPFIQAVEGCNMSKDLIDSLDYIIGNNSLWQDIEEITGREIATRARNRANELRGICTATPGITQPKSDEVINA